MLVEGRIIYHPAIKNDYRAIRDASAVRTIWVADAHRVGGKRFVVRADEKLTAFTQLEAALRDCHRVNVTTQIHKNSKKNLVLLQFTSTAIGAALGFTPMMTYGGVGNNLPHRRKE